MSWPIHCCLFLYCTLIFVLKDCQSFFLRHVNSGKCITTGGLVYNKPNYAKPYYAVMTDNCLDVKAQFYYYNDTEILRNIKTDGTLASTANSAYNQRLFVYVAVSTEFPASYIKLVEHSLKLSASGSLYFYKKKECGEPLSNNFVKRITSDCGKPKQKFTFGSVTAYNSKMKDVQCSPIQRLVIKKADYGNFDKNNTFKGNPSIDTTCSTVTSCRVKFLCGGNRSCELTMDNSVLLSKYCSDTSKEIYTEYTCVDKTSFITGANVRLSKSPNEGFIEIKDGPTWRKVNEENWDEDRQTMLCQHLGFEENADKNIAFNSIASGQQIATGHLICYKTQPKTEISCCIYVEPFTTVSETTIPYVKCGKICDKPLLENVTMFPDAVFSGSGGSSDYHQARFYGDGWCSSGSGTEYLLIDLQNDYHITQVVIMGDKNQTKLSNSSISLKYSHTETLVDGSTAVNLTGNKNGYQASTTLVEIYNVRYIKIQPFGATNICLRIELCGEVQLPAPVKNLMAKPSNFSVNLSWTIPETKLSSYITHFIIYLNSTRSDSTRIAKISRVEYGNKFVLRGLKLFTEYTVGIQAQDGSLKNATIVYQSFKTEEAVPSGPPMNVTVDSQSKDSLGISWKAPDKNLRNGKLTGYQVCYSSSVVDENRECLRIESSVLSYNIPKLHPSTKYFVTVSAITKTGYGEKSLEVSKITNGEAINPLTISYHTLSLNIPKQKDYIIEVMVIVKNSIRSSVRSENLRTSDLKPYKRNITCPYVTAYLKANGLPLTFVVGDGREYNSEEEKYFNHPLKQNSKYIVFLRFFENQNSFYSTEWSGNVTTMMEPTVKCADSENTEQLDKEKTRLDLIIPLVISISCFLLSLCVNVYQRRLVQSNNGQQCHKCEASKQEQEMIKLDSLRDNKRTKDIKASPEDQSYVTNDEAVYELPDSESTERNQAEPEISTGQEFSTYMSLKKNKDPENAYQSLQPKKDNVTAMEYENPAFNFSGK